MSATIIETLTEKLRVRTQELMAAEDKLRKVDREFKQLAEDEANLRTDLQNAQAKIVKQETERKRLVRFIDIHAERFHPDYGCCDALGADGMCSECDRIVTALTADKARLDWIEHALWHDHRIGNGLVIWPFTATASGERFIELQDLGDEDGSNLGDTLTKKWQADLRSAIDAAMKGGEV